MEQELDTPSLSDLRHPSTRGARARHTFSVRSPPPVHSWSKSQTHLLCQISATRPLVEQELDTPSLSDLRHPSTRGARARHTFSVRSPPPVHSWSKSQTHLLCQISATRPLVEQEPDTPSLSDLRHPSTRGARARHTFSVRSPPPVHSWSKSQTHLLCQISDTRPLVTTTVGAFLCQRTVTLAHATCIIDGDRQQTPVAMPGLLNTSLSRSLSCQSLSNSSHLCLSIYVSCSPSLSFSLSLCLSIHVS